MAKDEKKMAPAKPEEAKKTPDPVPKVQETKEAAKTVDAKKDAPKPEVKETDKAAPAKPVPGAVEKPKEVKSEAPKDEAKTAAKLEAEKAGAEKPAPVAAEKPKEVKPEVSKVETKASEKTAPLKAEAEKPKPEVKKAEAEKLKEEKAKDEKPAGPAATGPTVVSITQVLKDKLNPPSDKEIEELPLPKEGEAFYAVLHPKYLVNSDLNRFSVDVHSDNFKELLKSIEQNGIKEPVKARPKKDGKGIEIVSGQRRHIVATMLGYPVPTIIERIDDEDAKIQIADGNLHRDKISSYDLSRSLRMKMEAMKQKAGRRRKTDPHMPRMDTDEIIAKEMGISVPKLNRIIRLSEAEKVICDRVDDGSLALSIAYSISFLKPENQEKVSDLMDINYKVSTERIERMKKVEKAGKLTDSMMRDILEDKDLIPKEPPKPIVPAAPNVTIKPSTPGVSSIPTPAPVLPPAPANTVAAPSPMVSTFIPKSPDVVSPAPVPQTVKAESKDDVFKGEQERPQSTKIILAGDRLRKYFPDVEMTPREIEESIYEALEERRQRQEKMKAKSEHKFTR